MVHHIAIFASGNGSNAKVIIAHFKQHPEVKIALLITNNPAAPVIEIAAESHIPVATIPNHELEKNCLSTLQDYNIDFVVLAGFLRKIPHDVIVAFSHRIINIHPALLPKFGGKGMYGVKVHEAVVAAKEKITGITIHYVNEHYDEGQIIFQKSVAVHEHDTPDMVAEKVLQLEHQHYPKIIEQTILKHT